MRSDFINKRNLDRRRTTPPSQPTLVDREIILIPTFDTFIWHSSVPGNDRWGDSIQVFNQNEAKFSPQLPIGLLNPWNDHNDQPSGLLPPGGPPTSTLAVRTPTRIVMGFDMTGVPTAANITEATLSLTVSSSENWVDMGGSLRFAEQSYSPSVEVYKDGMFYRLNPLTTEETEEERQARIERYLEVYTSGAPPEEEGGSSGPFPPEIYDPEIPGILWWDDTTEVDGRSPEAWYLPCTRQQDNRKIHPNYPVSPMLIPCDSEVPDIFNGRCPEFVLEDDLGFGEVYRGNGSRWWFRDGAGRWWFFDDWYNDINSRNNPDLLAPMWIPYVPGLGVPIGGDGSLRRWFERTPGVKPNSYEPNPWFPFLHPMLQPNRVDDYIDDGIPPDFIDPDMWVFDDPTWKTNPKYWWKNFRYPPPGFKNKPDNYPCPPTRTPPFIA